MRTYTHTYIQLDHVDINILTTPHMKP